MSSGAWAAWHSLGLGQNPLVAPWIAQIHIRLPSGVSLRPPSGELITLVESGALHRPSINALALVMLAGSAAHTSRTVLDTVTALSSFLVLVHQQIGTETRLRPEIHYRPGFLLSALPKGWSQHRILKLCASYDAATEWMNGWIKTLPQTEAVAASSFRLPALLSLVDLVSRTVHGDLEGLSTLLKNADETARPSLTSALEILTHTVVPAGVSWAPHLALYLVVCGLRDSAETRLAGQILDCHRSFLREREGRPSEPSAPAAEMVGVTLEREMTAVREIDSCLRAGFDDKILDQDLKRFLYIPSSDVGCSLGWEPLRSVTPPDLFRFCELRMPSSGLAFKRAAGAVRFLAKRSEFPFYQQLLFTTVALATEESNLAASTILGCVQRVGTGLFNVLQTLEIEEAVFETNEHLLKYLESPAESVGSTDANLRTLAGNYSMAASSVLSMLERDEASRVFAGSAFLPFETFPIFDKTDGEFFAGRRQRAQQNHNFVINNWDDIHLVAEKRYLLMRKIMLQFRETQYRHHPEDYPIPIHVSQGEHASDLKFLLWDMESFLRVKYGGVVKRSWRKGFSSAPFLEYCGSENKQMTADEPFWCAEILTKRCFSPTDESLNSWFNIQVRRALKRKSNFGSPHHAILKAFFSFVVQERRGEGKGTLCLFDPDEIYGDVLIAQLYLRLVRSTGARIHEIMQIRTEPDFFYQRWEQYFFKVAKKGQKRDDSRKRPDGELFVSSAVLRIVSALIDQQKRMGVEFKVVKPGNLSLIGLSEGKYLLNNGTSGISDLALRQKIYFLLHGISNMLGGSDDDRTYPHGFRYGFINRMLREGFETETVASVVDHEDLRMTLSYGAMTAKQSEDAQKMLEQVFLASDQAKAIDLLIFRENRDLSLTATNKYDTNDDILQYLDRIEESLIKAESILKKFERSV